MVDGDMISLTERFSNMIRQENTIYQCTNDCSQPVWRENICDWSYRVVDHYVIDRETVSVSLSFLDRFLPRCNHPVNHKQFQLAAMTSLYMAIKMYESTNLTISLLNALSRVSFTKTEIITMEKEILNTLSWNVHPPTPLAFADHLLLLLPEEWCSSPSVKLQVSEVSRFQTELSVCDFFFVTHKPSSIALACVLIAMEQARIPRNIVLDFVENVRRVAMLDADGWEVEECLTKLREQEEVADATQSIQTQGAERYESVSPVFVSQMVDVATTERQQAQLKVAKNQLEKAEQNAIWHIMGCDDYGSDGEKKREEDEMKAVMLEEDLAMLANEDGCWDDSKKEEEGSEADVDGIGNWSSPQPTLCSTLSGEMEGNRSEDGGKVEEDEPTDACDL